MLILTQDAWAKRLDARMLVGTVSSDDGNSHNSAVMAGPGGVEGLYHKRQLVPFGEFANLTNDGWYKDTSGPIQHFHTNMFRAIENRVTILRAANTGISAVIDPYGVIHARTAIGQRARVEYTLPAGDPFPRGSFFARTGDWFGFTCMILTLALLMKRSSPRKSWNR